MKKTSTKNEELSRSKLPGIASFCRKAVLMTIFGVFTLTGVFAQQQRVSVDISNGNLSTVLQAIKDQTGLNFVMNADNMRNVGNVSIKAVNKPVEEVLQEVLRDTGYEYVIQSNSIIIRSKPQSQGQRATITGTVKDPEGDPVIGATVKILGTDKGAATDFDGAFSITEIISPSTKIEISYLGMETRQMTIGNQRMFNIVLEHSSQTIESVVITGMQNIDKRMFTGAADQLLANDIKLDGVADISRALEGRSAGVSVSNVSGTFGTAPRIRVRGATSIHGDSKPLWVLDGVPIDDVSGVSADDLASGDVETLISSAIAGLNSDDIESIQILKDGSATSIYGARAMAGVIVVTTKKGKAGVNSINYTGEFTMRLMPQYRDYNILNSQDQMSVYQEMEDKGWLGFTSIYTSTNQGVYGKMAQGINIVNTKTGQFEVVNNIIGKNAYLREAEFRNTNWFKELFNWSVQQNHSISLSSGTEKSTYYASLSALIDPGWTKTSKVNRYTANINATYKLYKNLSLNLIANTSYRNQVAPGTLSRETDALYGTVSRNFDINPYSYALNTSRALDKDTFYQRNYAPFNILHELNNNYMDLNVQDSKFQAEFSYKPIKKVEIKALGAVKYSTNTTEHHVMDGSNQAEAYRAMATGVIINNNKFLYDDPDQPSELPISVVPSGGFYKRTDNSLLSYDFRASAIYNDVFNDVHKINLFGGMEINSSERHRTWFQGVGMQYDLGEIAFWEYEYFKQQKEYGNDYYALINSRSRDAAFVVNGAYSYDQRYTFNGTLRYEGSNRLGKSRVARWLPTWNLSGSWDVTEENFMESVKPAISHLKLRASYSLTGTRGANITNSAVIIRSGTVNYRPTPGVQESYLYLSAPENNQLTYEKKHELNIGLDAGFIDNRISFSFDWYRRNNHDLVGPVVTDGTGGWITKSSGLMGNVASMKSSGTEFSLTTKNIRNKDFSWETSFIFSYNKTEVTEYFSYARAFDLISGSSYTMKGYPARALFSLKFEGLNDEGLPVLTNQKGEKSSTSFDLQDRINRDHLVYEGPMDPTITGSLGNIFRYKGFRLNVFITYSFGNVIRLDPAFSYAYSDLTAHSREFNNRWVLPGDELLTDVPTIASRRQYQNYSGLRYGYNAYNYSTVRVAKGDFIRMKEISFSYDFDKALISKLKINSLSLKLQATNPFLIYSDKKLQGQDPEFFNSGGVASPMARQFTFTVRIGL